MATLMKCDECGAVITGSSYMCIKAYKPVIKVIGIDYPDKTLDLCMGCYKEMFNIKEDNE